MIDRIVEGWAENGFGLWAVEGRLDERFLGFVGLSRPSFDAPFMPAVEVGWRLARDAWGLGYATEGGRASLRYGFEEIGLEFARQYRQQGWDVVATARKSSGELDATKTPKTIDYAMTEGITKGKQQLGIYELNGDTFKSCFAKPGAERPGDFKPGEGRTVSVWKREEAVAKPEQK